MERITNEKGEKTLVKNSRKRVGLIVHMLISGGLLRDILESGIGKKKKNID